MASSRAAGGPSHTCVVNLSLRIVHRYSQVTNSVLAQDIDVLITHCTVHYRRGLANKNRTIGLHWQFKECAQR